MQTLSFLFGFALGVTIVACMVIAAALAIFFDD